MDGSPTNYVVSTDASGFFTLTTGLSGGSYNWRLKGPKNLANAGTLTLAGGTNNVEFGVQRAGDANNNNVVNSPDFNIVKSAFGGNDPRADFNNDGVVNALDFNILKGNFGQSGPRRIAPEQPIAGK